jgi:phosphohistidine phosphatase
MQAGLRVASIFSWIPGVSLRSTPGYNPGAPSALKSERSPAIMRVYLVQHGKSKSEEEDPQRRLTDEGIGEVQNVADFLRPLKLAVDAIWHSDKARAQQTGELLAGAVSARDRLVQRAGLGPKDQVAATKEAFEQTGGDLMIVGHLPFLGKLVALLVTGNEKNEIVEFRFGCVVCVERSDDKKWKVAWVVTPSLLHA